MDIYSGIPVFMDYYNMGVGSDSRDYPQVLRGTVISLCDHEEEGHEEYGHYKEGGEDCKHAELAQKEESLAAWAKSLRRWHEDLRSREQDMHERNMDEIYGPSKELPKFEHGGKYEDHTMKEEKKGISFHEEIDHSKDYWGADAKCKAYQMYIDTHGYHFSKELAAYAVSKMKNADGSSRVWKMPEVKEIMERLNMQKPEHCTWGDVLYVFSMYYSDGFPKVYRTEHELAKATISYLTDPDAPEGIAFIRWIAMMDFVKEKITWSEMI